MLQVTRVGAHARHDSGEDVGLLLVVHRERVMCAGRRNPDVAATRRRECRRGARRSKRSTACGSPSLESEQRPLAPGAPCLARNNAPRFAPRAGCTRPERCIRSSCPAESAWPCRSPGRLYCTHSMKRYGLPSFRAPAFGPAVHDAHRLDERLGVVEDGLVVDAVERRRSRLSRSACRSRSIASCSQNSNAAVRHPALDVRRPGDRARRRPKNRSSRRTSGGRRRREVGNAAVLVELAADQHVRDEVAGTSR